MKDYLGSEGGKKRRKKNKIRIFYMVYNEINEYATFIVIKKLAQDKIK